MTWKAGHTNFMETVSRTVLSSITFCDDRKYSMAALSKKIATNLMWPFSTGLMISVTKEFHFKFCLILTRLNLNLNHHICLVATVLKSTILRVGLSVNVSYCYFFLTKIKLYPQARCLAWWLRHNLGYLQPTLECLDVILALAPDASFLQCRP